MRVAFATAYDARTPSRWTGWTATGHFLGVHLQRAGAKVDWLGPATAPPALRARFRLDEVLGVLRGGRHSPLGDPAILHHYGRVLSSRLAASDASAVLCHGMQAASFLETDLPVAMRSDVTVAAIIDRYENMTGLAPATRLMILEAEDQAFERADLLVFSNEWAAGEARERYGVPAEKIRVSPPGANLDPPPTRPEVEERVARVGRPHRLLLSGVSWRRKGGDFALSVLEAMRGLGAEATLTVAGMTPPAGAAMPRGVETVGFVNRLTEEGDRDYRSLLASSSLLLHPAKADADPGVIREAAAYGVPCLAPDLMGIPTVMGQGRVGALLPPAASPSDWAWAAAELLGDYPAAAMRARDYYEERLDWVKNAEALLACLRDLAA